MRIVNLVKATVIVMMAVLCLAAPALAQSAAPGAGSVGPGGGSGGGGISVPGIELGGSKAVDPATLEKRKEIERAYRDAVRSAPPAQQTANDPWANMRGADEAKPAPKAKPAQASAQKNTQKKATAQ